MGAAFPCVWPQPSCSSRETQSRRFLDFLDFSKGWGGGVQVRTRHARRPQALACAPKGWAARPRRGPVHGRGAGLRPGLFVWFSPGKAWRVGHLCRGPRQPAPVLCSNGLHHPVAQLSFFALVEGKAFPPAPTLLRVFDFPAQCLWKRLQVKQRSVVLAREELVQLLFHALVVITIL